ncbi:MAG: hypothetical protein QMC80_01765 [Thermoplasmatales archaeon]|nr:hypothetical protein [Thermoplasmatales archaeon]
MFGRGRGFGMGFGGMYGMGVYGMGFGRGRGNLYGFCRRFPWLPRWWWTGMYGNISPWVMMPFQGYGMPYYGMGTVVPNMYGYGTPSYGTGYRGYPYVGYGMY